ncbi:MAG: hypothetical protein HYX79_05720 [Chloroflexi bacterium]|nr:hypothetical protein [Chloroflexota bacterium]
MIGLVIIGVILVPVIAIIATFMLETRRKPRVPGLFLGSLVVQVTGIVASFVLLGALMGMLIP